MQSWFIAISLFYNSKEIVSARKLADRIRVTKDTANRMINKMRLANKDEQSLLEEIARSII